MYTITDGLVVMGDNLSCVCGLYINLISADLGNAHDTVLKIVM